MTNHVRGSGPKTTLRLPEVSEEQSRYNEFRSWTDSYMRNAPKTFDMPRGALTAHLMTLHQEKYGRNVYAQNSRGVASKFISMAITNGDLVIINEVPDDKIEEGFFDA
jgi:hypothetical protein